MKFKHFYTITNTTQYPGKLVLASHWRPKLTMKDVMISHQSDEIFIFTDPAALGEVISVGPVTSIKIITNTEAAGIVNKL